MRIIVNINDNIDIFNDFKQSLKKLNNYCYLIEHSYGIVYTS